MDEIGVDISSTSPKSFDDFEDTPSMLVLTLSPESHHKAK